MSDYFMLSVPRSEVVRFQEWFVQHHAIQEGPPAYEISEYVPHIWFQCSHSEIQVWHSSMDLSYAWASAVAVALAERLVVHKAGAPSIGYCESVEEFLTFRPFPFAYRTLSTIREWMIYLLLRPRIRAERKASERYLEEARIRVSDL